MSVYRRYDPYYCNLECREMKTSPRRQKRKQCLVLKRTSSADKVKEEKCLKKTCSPSTNFVTVGNYLLSESNPSNCMCKAVHIDTEKVYACRIVTLSKYRETITPYTLVNSHEGINHVVEVLFEKQNAYLIFERSYGDLHTYIRAKKRLKEEEVCRLFKQIVDVVNYCHSMGLVLRDLKLRKFVFKDPERTQLKMQSLDSVHIIGKEENDILYDKHGCPAYVSPEILESTNGYSSKAADVWSLGVIAFTMISGRYPFHEPEPSALFAKIKTGHFIIPDTVSAPGKCLIHSILRKIPTERLTTEELLEHPWFTLDFESLLTPNFCQRQRYDQLVPDLNTNSKCSFIL